MARRMAPESAQSCDISRIARLAFVVTIGAAVSLAYISQLRQEVDAISFDRIAGVSVGQNVVNTVDLSPEDMNARKFVCRVQDTKTGTGYSLLIDSSDRFFVRVASSTLGGFAHSRRDFCIEDKHVVARVRDALQGMDGRAQSSRVPGSGRE
jgi:hypothetical protein